jgi:hypothetical protein
MLFLWLIAAAFALFVLIQTWRKIEHGLCVSALCLLQSFEERFDAYSEKGSAPRYSPRLQKLC